MARRLRLMPSRRRISHYVTVDYHEWLPFDLILPRELLHTDLTAYQYHPERARSSYPFGISITRGQGAVVSRDFLNHCANQWMVSDYWIAPQDDEHFQQGYHRRTSGVPGYPHWNIIGSAKLKFWVRGLASGTVVDCRYHAAVTDSHLTDSRHSPQTWIGTDHGRIHKAHYLDHSRRICIVTEDENMDEVEVLA